MPRRNPDWPTIAAAAAGGAALGALIYGNLFTEGKRLTQKVVAPYAIGDDDFFRSVPHLLSAPFVPGNKVTHLQNGVKIFPAMLEAIRSAKRSICFENFVFAEGRLTREFSEALSERARAGVKVHFLQDALGCNCLHGADIDRMEEAGVEVEIYRWYHLTRINERTHRKLLIVDGKVGFTGGVGIGDVWLGDGDHPGAWRDSHFKVEGPAAGDMQQAFLDNWMATRGVVLHGDMYFPKLETAGDELCQVFKSSADEGSDSTRLLYLLTCAAARKSLRIANAYFIPDSLLLDAILDARLRGVEIEILLPGPNIDHKFVRAVSRDRWRKLLRAGVRFFEYQPSNYHCKILIADDSWVSVGSTNLDSRSLVFNEECNVNIYDHSFAREMIQVFENDKTRSREISYAEWAARPLGQKVFGLVGQILRRQL